MAVHLQANAFLNSEASAANCPHCRDSGLLSIISESLLNLARNHSLQQLEDPILEINTASCLRVGAFHNPEQIMDHPTCEADHVFH